MRRSILQTKFYLLSVLLSLASCSQDELAEQDTALPDGMYPMTFTAVQVAPENTPQTRVSDYDEGGEHKSKWTIGDKITVTVSKDGYTEKTTCTLDENGKITEYSPQLYWQTTENYNINAWYYSNITGQSTGAENTVSLADQSGGLAYVLKADPVTENYKKGNIDLTFSHQLAKVRVKLEKGSYEGDLSGATVKVKSHTSCTVRNGEVSEGSGEGYITMHKNGDWYEANLVPGTLKASEAFEISADNKNTKANLQNEISLEKGNVYEVSITVNQQMKDVDFSAGNATISEDGNYRITGNNSGKGLKIEVPNRGFNTVLRSTITLDNTTLESINMAETAQGGAAYVTFIIRGNVTVSKGIVAKCGGEIRIEGTAGSKLTITSPDWCNPAIGNLNNYRAGVALFIEDATVEATGAGSAAVIGTSSGWPGDGSVGDITIKNSTLTLTAVYGDCGNPAVIGTGATDTGNLSCGNINIYLKDGQSKTDFLQSLKGSYNQQVGVGNASGGSVSCGSINWYNSDGSPAN